MSLYPGDMPGGVDPYAVKFTSMSSHLTNLEQMLYGSHVAINTIPPELAGYINPVWYHTLMGLCGITAGFVVIWIWSKGL